MSTRYFLVNNQSAFIDNFGEYIDTKPDEAPDYGCGHMAFVPKEISPEALNKYNITENEYKEICKILEEKLDWGACDLCN